MIRLLIVGLALASGPAFAQDLGGAPGASQPGGQSDGPARDRGGDARQVSIQPYIEIDQTVFAELSPGDDATTYTSVAAGIDAFVATRNVEGQISARYERRFGWEDDGGDDDVLSGLARASAGIGRDFTIEGGGFAARTRSFGGGPFFDLGGNDDAVSDLYSIYAGPSFATALNGIDLAASYRLGYTRLTDRDVSSGIPGRPTFDYFDDSTVHLAQASIGSAPGRTLPVGWGISGAFSREDVGELDQRFEGWYVRGDIVVPVSATLAAVGGVGWEDIESSRAAPVVDGTGEPVVDGDGRLIADRTAPRLVAVTSDALYWDVGLSWRPSPRTSLEIRAGERYESFTAFGSFNWQFGRDSALSVTVYDTVDSFGRRLTQNLNDMPTRFRSGRNVFGGGFGGCVFGVQEGQAGGCLTSTLAAISSSDYRTRGFDVVIGSQAGRWSYGIGGGYSNRDYYVPDLGPGVTVFGFEDQNAYAQGYVGYQLSPRSSIDGQVYTTWYDSGFANGEIVSTGAVGTWNYSFGRFDALAALGIQGFKQDGFEDSATASAQLGMRYNF